MSGKIEYSRILWLLACTDSICDHLQPFYAISEEDAQRQAREWLEQRPSLKYISLRPYPRGFMLQHENSAWGTVKPAARRTNVVKRQASQFLLLAAYCLSF